MLLTYVDTSTLIKLIIEEPGSDAAAEIWDRSDTVIAARVLYVEARAALASAHRRSRLSAGQHRTAKAHLEGLWEQFAIVEVGDDLVRRAGLLAERYRLRGYDAVHLAAAHLVGAHILTSADDLLCQAASASGLHVHQPSH